MRKKPLDLNRGARYTRTSFRHNPERGATRWAAPFHICEEALDDAVATLFDADPQIQAVGIARHERQFGFKAVKNIARIVPAAAARNARRTPRSIKKVPVVIEDVTADVEPHLMTPHPLAASFVPEQQQRRPLACGLQIQNVDDDDRQRGGGPGSELVHHRNPGLLRPPVQRGGRDSVEQPCPGRRESGAEGDRQDPSGRKPVVHLQSIHRHAHGIHRT